MCHPAKYFLASCLALTITLPAFGQRMRMMGGHPMMHSGMSPMVFHGPSFTSVPHPLFQNPSVARHLNITPQQSARLNAATTQLQQQFRQQFDRLALMDAERRQFQAMQLLGNFNTNLTRAAAGILDARQLGRLQQLEVQAQGLSTFMSPTVQKQLGLTQNQVTNLFMASQRNQRLMNEINMLSQRNPQAALSTLQQMLAGAENVLTTTLTPQQMQAFRNMTGTPFNFPPNMMTQGGFPAWMWTTPSMLGYPTGSGMGMGYGGGGGGYAAGSNPGYGQTSTTDYGQATAPDSGQTSPGTATLRTYPTERSEKSKGESPFLEPLFRLDHVARKLSLTPDQFYRLNTLTDQLRERYKPQLEKLTRLDEKERKERTREILRAYKADWMKGAEDILNARQMAQYREFVEASGNP